MFLLHFQGQGAPGRVGGCLFGGEAVAATCFSQQEESRGKWKDCWVMTSECDLMSLLSAWGHGSDSGCTARLHPTLWL